ncbi:hypothetical protein SAMD00019534_020610 [Acytostelium subglobosum LB1]|uniref:hypothetical protein n=1 Tax=Acytostelium subglobosum LB1 TaxID=1410327 RepID=UPI000644DFFD|nr:hypothetical protein SAMD00019534_020610 [Acytostelium subglobosum LB1]GAM18886.1 hypothetical protein SAMD00019534_020610 [Acytostelium subglobosum LB1]|eukprot:XP_012758106.1 hypothetical protein SAMD00019534_020610 [Acytostelium subglobosum LB1]
MDEDDDITLEQIKKLREDRKNGIKSTLNSDKKEFDSYHAPKNILDTIPIDPTDEDPLKSYRVKTVAEQETEYQARWRKRSFSPPRTYDPFTGKGEVKGRSYKDIMIENQLAREEQDLMAKISKKQKEEEEKKRAQQKAAAIEEESNKKKKIDASSSAAAPSSSASSSINGNGNGNGREKRWFLKVYKNGANLQTNVDITLGDKVTFGRDASNKVVLEHPSCSSKHATISILKEGKRPILIDLKSTNQTRLNDKEIEPHHPEELYHGDKIQFGGSSREYIVSHS